ncbi:MAG: rRNA small subunit methyltransferase B [Micrococcales bacterium]|nr:rRNA small subunit methyltransferase B [Micrococcales bacterium]
MSGSNQPGSQPPGSQGSNRRHQGPSRRFESRPGARGQVRQWGGDQVRARSKQAPSQRQRAADAPRRVAFDLLRAVDQGAYANLWLPKTLRQRDIWGRDAAFATELAYGTTRLRGSYDAVIDQVAGRARIDPEVRDCLRLGVHQIANMRVPDHAAVAATVAVACEAIGIGPANFVNAILRAVTEQGYEAVLAAIAPDDGSVEHLALRLSYPEWVVRALRQALIGSGRQPGDLAGVLAAGNEHTATTLVARPTLISPEQLAEQIEQKTGRAAQPGRYLPTALTMSRGAPGDLPAIRHGQAAVQDEGSQLVAWALAQAPLASDQGQWLDLCAGPGGKAAFLAGLLAQSQKPGLTPLLTANEPQGHRADLVKQALRQFETVCQVTQLDGRDLTGSYDRVLVDVPCTGLGALSRRPEARWRHQPQDLGSLRPLQRQLLRAGIGATKTGGLTLYATCSPHLAETRHVISDVLESSQGVEVVDLAQVPQLAATGAVQSDGMAQLWTDQHGTDAMFLALLRKVGD